MKHFFLKNNALIIVPQLFMRNSSEMREKILLKHKPENLKDLRRTTIHRCNKVGFYFYLRMC